MPIGSMFHVSLPRPMLTPRQAMPSGYMRPWKRPLDRFWRGEQQDGLHRRQGHRLLVQSAGQRLVPWTGP
jgi:hypothetical protein